ncbi:MAG: arylformamidase [Gammaproteobacteria bacterium]|jgi:arylformamidase
MPFDYMNLPTDAFEAHFNPREAATEVDEKVARMGDASRQVRAQYAHSADVRYGAGARQTLDIFPPLPQPPARTTSAPLARPVQLFVHGGFWRAMSKDDYSFIAPPYLEAGGCAVIINYDLAPTVTLDEIVAQTIESVAWTYRNIAQHGGDPNKLYMSGNSAGAHLVAMALAHDWEADGLPADIIKGATPITGVMDCAPVLNISVNKDVRLDAEMAARNSPIFHLPRRALPLIIAVGGSEPTGWVELSRAYMRACEAAGLAPRYMEIPGLDHFDISAAMGDPHSPLTHAIIEQMGLQLPLIEPDPINAN